MNRVVIEFGRVVEKMNYSGGRVFVLDDISFIKDGDMRIDTG